MTRATTSTRIRPAHTRGLVEATARWLALASLTLIFYAALLLIYLGVCAWRMGYDPPVQADFAGGDGPWKHLPVLQVPLADLLEKPVFAAAFALLSWLLRPRRTTFVLLAVSVALVVLLNWQCRWLIE